uniref:ENTH domain-containing protein n=1 Tax=Paramormyrops kingsleyae TaxID=1676925 RepID=A0A3B3QK95_9TELE
MENLLFSCTDPGTFRRKSDPSIIATYPWYQHKAAGLRSHGCWSVSSATPLYSCGQYLVSVNCINRVVPVIVVHSVNLIQATNETNVNIPQMADTLFERATNASWVVVFKALVTTHHMMVLGNERFIQYLASRNTLFNLSNFLDKTGSHGE